jgi:hypothetical protein
MSDDVTPMPATLDPDAIVAEAQRSLDHIDSELARLRQVKANVGQEIALLREDRKPLARLVAAANPRQRKAQANGD